MAKKIKIQVYDDVAKTKTWLNVNADIINGEVVFSTGPCLKSPDTSTWVIKVDDAGTLTTQSV